jgi:hypothetical protein
MNATGQGRAHRGAAAGLCPCKSPQHSLGTITTLHRPGTCCCNSPSVRAPAQRGWQEGWEVGDSCVLAHWGAGQGQGAGPVTAPVCECELNTHASHRTVTAFVALNACMWNVAGDKLQGECWMLDPDLVPESTFTRPGPFHMWSPLTAGLIASCDGTRVDSWWGFRAARCR